jgi:hypothetical protein
MTKQSGTVIFVDVPGLKSMGSAASIMVAANGWKAILLAGVPQALESLKSSADIRAVVANAPDETLFQAVRNLDPGIITVLVTDLPMQDYCASLGHNDILLIDHVIANTDAEWTTSDLAITLQKIIRSDLFGIEKYLSPQADIQSRIIKGSADRDPSNKAVTDWVEACGLGKNLSRLASGICEELLMNAIYDAPVAGGRTHYEAMERREKRNLADDEWATLKFGCDGRIFAISIQDPFGAFARDRWFTYLRKVLKRNDTEQLIDTKKGGAGLGLFNMLYSSHGVVCNVEPGKITEVIVLIALNNPVRDFVHMPRSIHYFNTSSH